MYSRVANDAPSSRTDHPERTSRRLCRTSQPTLSSTSAVAGSDRAESTLGSRPPAPRAVDRPTASTAPTHDRRQGVQPGFRTVSERASSVRALPARPPQIHRRPSSRYTRTAAIADGSSGVDDPVEQGTPYLSFPLSAAAEDDDRSYTRRAIDSSTEGGARVHPPVFTHPRGMEGVRSQTRTSPAAYWPGDSRFAFEPATIAHDLRAGARGVAAPVARPLYHTLAEREAHVDTLPEWQRVYVAAQTSRTGDTPSTVTMRASSEQMDDAPVYRSGTPQSPLHDAAGPDQISHTRRTLQSVVEGAARVSPSYPHPRGVEGVLLPRCAPPARSSQRYSLAPITAAKASRTGHTAQQRSTLEAVRLESVDVASIAESVGATMRTVYDIGKQYISRFSSDVVNIARDLANGPPDAQHDDRGTSASRSFSVSPSASSGDLSMSALTLCSPPAPWTVPSSYVVETVQRTSRPQSAAAGVYADSGAQWPDAHKPFDGLPPSLNIVDPVHYVQSAVPYVQADSGPRDDARRALNSSTPSPYAAELYALRMFPSVADSVLLNNGRSNPTGCDISYESQSLLPTEATNNSVKSTSQRTPALEGGAGVLRPKSHPQAMEGTSAEDVLPVYAETSVPGRDSRFALESKMPYTTAKAPSEKHRQSAYPKDKSASLNAETEQWVHNVSPIAVHMFSRAAENPAACAVLESLQGGSQRVRSTPLPPQVTQPSAVSISSKRAGRVRSSARANGRDDRSASSRDLDASRSERRARALRNAKLPMPTYDGCADLRRYEEFVFKWDSWIRNRRLGESDSVELMYNALTGEALEWYLSFVAMSDYTWTSCEIYQELYEYCFPSNFREDLRLQLMSSRQDGRPVKRFAKDLQNLAMRFSDVGQSTLKRLLWDGVDPYIRVFWVEKGRSAEYDDYNTLVLYAHRAERREAEIRRCLDSEGAEVETELSPCRENNPDRDVTAHAVRMRQGALRSEELPVPMEYEEPEYSEGEQEYYSEEEPGHDNNEEELVEAEGAYPQQFDDEYEEGEEEYYHSQDESESREHESQDPQGEYYEDEYEEYGEAEHQPDEYGDEDYPYLEGHEERNEEGEDYYDEEGEEEVDYYDNEAGDEDEEDGHSGEPPLNTGRNEYGEDEYESEGSLYED